MYTLVNTSMRDCSSKASSPVAIEKLGVISLGGLMIVPEGTHVVSDRFIENNFSEIFRLFSLSMIKVVFGGCAVVVSEKSCLPHLVEDLPVEEVKAENLEEPTEELESVEDPEESVEESVEEPTEVLEDYAAEEITEVESDVVEDTADDAEDEEEVVEDSLKSMTVPALRKYAAEKFPSLELPTTTTKAKLVARILRHAEAEG